MDWGGPDSVHPDPVIIHPDPPPILPHESTRPEGVAGRGIGVDRDIGANRGGARWIGVAFKRAAFYQSLKSKVGLAAAKAAALRINLTIQGCGVVALPLHAPSRAPLFLPLLLSHNIPLPRVH
jgi:hypothetical protein